MKVITAVEKYNKKANEITCFLAGGITDCSEWQDEVLEYLRNSKIDLSNLVIFNPRRKNFPIHDPNASNEQITWEFNMLEQMDIFSMYFDYSEKSPQPICFYELGRNIVKMQDRFPNDWKNRIIVNCNNKFSRINDVKIQTSLAIKDEKLVNINSSPILHAQSIINKYIELNNR